MLYKFSVSVVSSEGESEKSLYLTAASSPPPDTPVAIYKNSLLSDKTTLSLYWDRVANADISTTGYRLEMAIAGIEEFKIVYDGTNNAQQFAYNVTSLETNGRY